MTHAATFHHRPAVASLTADTAPPRRLYYVQWLRVLLITLVVAQHAAEPYVVTGGDWVISDPAKSAVLLAPFVLNGTFFMALFFLISGYFLDASIDRHGPGHVVTDRLLRLGLPLVVIVVFVNGLVGWLMFGEGLGYFAFLTGPYIPANLEFGPLWFIAHLLVYILAYTAWRSLIGGEARWLRAPKAPGHLGILAFVLGLGAVTALTRIWYPIDAWVKIGGILPTEPARLPQYLAFFAIGILAGRGRWFDEIETRVALAWFGLGLALFAVTAALALPRLALPDDVALRIAWGFLEAPIGTGMILGLVVLFRGFAARRNRWLGWLEGQVYGVYLFHLYFVLAAQGALLSFGWPGLAKWALVTLAALALSFGFAALLRLIPGARRIL